MNKRLVGLGAVAALLGGYLAFDSLGSFLPGGDPAQPSPDAVATHAAAQVNLNALEGLDPESFTAIVDRPLFNPSRQPRPEEPPEPPPPPEEPVVEQPPPPPPPPQGPGPQDYKLLGVSSGPDGRIAALRVAASGQVVYLRKGESVDSWSVVDVGDRSVTIGPPESPVTYQMFVNEDASGGMAGGQPGVPPSMPGAQPLPLPLPMPQPQPQPGQPPLPEQHTVPDTGG